VAELSVIGGGAVLIGRGVLATPDFLPQREGRSRVAVLTQPGATGIGRAVANRLEQRGLKAALLVLPDGEEAKSLAVVEEVYRWLIDLGLTRDDCIVGVGGGALTDVAGFVAATYLRGIESVYVTTTLLGAVDASIGGKTGVNLGGKNLVGAFHMPAGVVIDVEVLDSLPLHLKREGAAEALKAGLVGDPDLVALYEAEGMEADLLEVVTRAVAVKSAIVDEDFTDRGIRAILNYGHTIGHAVETAARLSHGEAVAVGMVAAGRAASLLLGFPDEDRQRRIIGSLGLPVSAAGIDPAAVRGLIELDKKRDAAGSRMVLLARVGDPRIQRVDSATVEAALQAVGI
jgi:3-dehydroquinate synthetase